MRLRLLPFLFLALIGIGVQKIGELIYNDQSGLHHFSLISELSAQQPENEGAAEPASSTEETPPAEAVPDGEKVEPAADAAAPTTDTTTARPPAIPDNISKSQFSDAELNVLQSLSRRREALDMREKEISLREEVLKAAEKQVQERIDTLKGLQKQVDELLVQYNEKQNEKIRSLVKIYENMKPKAAAQIFEKMDMPVLLDVVSHMKEAKTSPILASMDPLKAKDLTTALAKRKTLPPVDSLAPAGQ